MALFGRTKPDAPAPLPVPPPELAEPRRLEGAPPAGMSGLRSVPDQLEYLLSQVASLRPFGIGLLDADGLTLCESLQSDINIPVVSTAKVDGWAVRGSNVVGASPNHPVRLPIVGEIDAGGFRGAPLMAGTVVRVAAGAPVPEGSDAVVALENGTVRADEVEFTAETSFHENLLLAGSRITDGSPLLDVGTVLSSRNLGLLAEVGIDKVLARPKPRVVVASIGPDLVEPGLALERIGQVYDSTTALIAATARADGAQVFPIGILPSDFAGLRQRLSDQLLRADLVLIAASYTPELLGVLGQLGAVDEAEVAIAPGGSAVFAIIGEERVPVVVLPRETVAAYVSYQVFGRPLLRKLAGVEPRERAELTLPTVQPLVADPVRTSYVLAQTTDRGVAPIPVEQPGILELVGADALIVVEPGVGVDAHADVTCWLLKG